MFCKQDVQNWVAPLFEQNDELRFRAGVRVAAERYLHFLPETGIAAQPRSGGRFLEESCYCLVRLHRFYLQPILSPIAA
jgi:hypothetical protein